MQLFTSYFHFCYGWLIFQMVCISRDKVTFLCKIHSRQPTVVYICSNALKDKTLKDKTVWSIFFEVLHWQAELSKKVLWHFFFFIDHNYYCRTVSVYTHVITRYITCTFFLSGLPSAWVGILSLLSPFLLEQQKKGSSWSRTFCGQIFFLTRNLEK